MILDDAGARVRVLLPLPLDEAYDYRVPEGLTPAPGAFVCVPFGRREVIGVVWGGGSGEIAAERLKELHAVLDVPPLVPALRRFIDWVATYTLAPLGAVLRMAMSVPSALEPDRVVAAYALAPETAEVPPLRLTEARKRVLAAFTGSTSLTLAELERISGASASVIHGLADAGRLTRVVRDAAPASGPDWRRPGASLSAAQAEAASEIAQPFRAARGGVIGFGVTLLDGVTGSGKTEVYFEAMAAALAAGRQALVLLPEIALTAQWYRRFTARFGAAPLEWHSDLGTAERRRTWRAVARGEAQVVIGARSALFLPFSELGLIVVDEEHDSSFKQEEGVIYNARDMAIVRARLGEFQVVLSSATPSLETHTNCESGRYRRLTLPERFAGASLPRIRALDMRAEDMDRQSWISPALRKAVATTLDASEQAMLFLNRRGYAPLTLCRHCGNRLTCPNCTTWLVAHRLKDRLACHHCGYAMPPPNACTACGAVDSLAPCGPGVERVAEEARALWPRARIAIMASDTIDSVAAAQEIVRRIEAREIDLLIGTQIVAKGHHFPFLTLVGVIDADLGLAGGDLRAAERTYQLLHQVAGRAGRAERPGLVLLQTYLPEHPVMQAIVSGERDRFMAAEAEARRTLSLPPFGRLAAVIVSGEDEPAVDAASRALARSAPAAEGVAVLGPAPAPLAILRGRHRRRFLLKAAREVNVPAVLRRWIGSVRVKSGVRVQIDVDPYSFL